MTTEKLTEEQAERIKQIASDINNKFNWDKTKEGTDYWRKVYDALKRIAENGLKNNEKKVCDKCGQEIK